MAMHSGHDALLRSLLASFGLVLLAGCCLTGSNPVVSTAEFLGPDDFTGHYTQLRTPSFMGGQSHFDGDIVFTNLPRSIVEGILPDDLQLAANTVGSSDHPTLIVAGMQHSLSWITPTGWPIEIDKNYNEIMLIIPFVQAKGMKLWHNYVVRMYLDWPWAINAGNVLFGLQKEEASFVTTINSSPPPEYTRQVIKSIVMWQGETSGLTAWMNEGDATTKLPNYNAMLEIMKMPLIGQLSLLQSDPYVCSYFRWDLQDAQIRQSMIKHQYLQNFVPNMNSWISAGPLENVQQGGFSVEQLQWRMTSPLQCKF